MRQRNPSKGKSNFSEKKSKSSSFSREGKPSFRKEEGGEKRSYGKSSGEKSGDDKRPAFKKEGYKSREGSSSWSDKPKRSYGDGEKRSSFKKEGGYGKSDKSYSDKPKRSYGSDDKRPSFKKEGGYDKSEKSSYSDRPKRSYGSDEKRSSFKKEGGYGKSDRSYSDKPKRNDDSSGEKRTFYKKADGSYASIDKLHADKPRREGFGAGDKRSSFKKEEGSHRKSKRSFMEKPVDDEKRPFSKKGSDAGEEPEMTYTEKKHLETYEKLNKKKKKVSDDGTIRLNRYIANAGICSRREADVLIASGVVTVNGKVVTEMGHKIDPSAIVTYDGAAIKNEDKKYLLLNKPKDYITTMDDPQERKTVMELVKNACKERLYPVGRLDRNTTGLLLFTNDGDMTAKLTHPKHNIRKVYHVTLNKKITAEDFAKIEEGIELEDGFIKPDAIEYVEEGKREIGIEIHSGRNRIVRRIFEQMGYDVLRLDRVSFAGLTKKDIPRGKWRFLNVKEVNFLKMLK